MTDPIILTGDEVINMDNKSLSFFKATLLKFKDIDTAIKGYIELSFPHYAIWTGQGVRAEVLQPGKDWRKGKLKLVISYRVEFTPDLVPPSQSPLDDLRSQLDSK